jgi:transposase
MEATGVYWKPVWRVLERRFELVLANAAHVDRHRQVALCHPRPPAVVGLPVPP